MTTAVFQISGTVLLCIDWTNISMNRNAILSDRLLINTELKPSGQRLILHLRFLTALTTSTYVNETSIKLSGKALVKTKNKIPLLAVNTEKKNSLKHSSLSVSECKMFSLLDFIAPVPVLLTILLFTYLKICLDHYCLSAKVHDLCQTSAFLLYTYDPVLCIFHKGYVHGIYDTASTLPASVETSDVYSVGNIFYKTVH